MSLPSTPSRPRQLRASVVAVPFSPVSKVFSASSKKEESKEDEEEKEEAAPALTTTTLVTKKTTRAPPSLLSQLYKVIAKHHGLAYGTPNSPIYGENNKSSMTRAFEAMGLGIGRPERAGGGGAQKNVFCDVGSGTGAPSLHAACEYPDILSYGFELMGSRWWISQTILNDVLRNAATAELGSRVMLAHVDLGDLKDFGPCTHVFAFDTGFPQQALQYFARAFNASKHIQVLGSFHKKAVLDKAGFRNLELKTKVKMTMSGSSEGKQLLVYTVVRASGEEKGEADGDVKEQQSWDLPRLCAPPTKSEFQPTVEHGASYARGEDERLKGITAYQAWVQDQIGFARQASVGVRTRSSFKKL